ncbi:diguanylate cyclase [Tissierella praeacuta]|uniref:diguanylate cyclase n=1 Tax=Tissierella praeacuta TaxID=43131 RepID=UPI00289A3696|nr:diguanylate cyclase [Tissierella praeacuta]
MGTGIFNKKQGFIKLKGKIERYHIEKKSISIAFIDVDKLENINDKFGHCEGDKLINIIATIIKKYKKRRFCI